MTAILKYPKNPNPRQRSIIAGQQARVIARKGIKTGATRVDEFVQLGRCLCLCEEHARKFNERGARYVRIRPGRQWPTALGECDWDGQTEMCHIYMPADDHDRFHPTMQYERLRRR